MTEVRPPPVRPSWPTSHGWRGCPRRPSHGWSTSSPNVSLAVRERVHAAIAELGYRPNAAARALVTHRTRVIGILTPDSLLYGPTAQLFGLERAAHDAGYAVVIVSVPDGSAEVVAGALARLRRPRCRRHRPRRRRCSARPCPSTWSPGCRSSSSATRCRRRAAGRSSSATSTPAPGRRPSTSSASATGPCATSPARGPGTPPRARETGWARAAGRRRRRPARARRR